MPLPPARMPLPTIPWEREESTPRLHVVLLVLLTLVSVVSSWIGIDYQLPHVGHFDETVYHTQYRAFVEGDAEPEARRFFNAYPTAFAHAAALIPRFEPEVESGGLDAELAAAKSDTVFLRRFVALLAALIVPATWLLGRRFTTSGWSLVVAACAATSVMFVSFATQARPHALITVAVVFAVVASIDVARKGTLRASLLAGLACGASTLVLHSGIATLLPLLVAHALRFPRDGRRAAMRFAAALVPFVVLFLCANPGLFSKLFALDAGEGGAAFLLSHDAGWSRFRGGGAAIVLRAFTHYDPLVTAIAFASLLVGTVTMVARRSALRGVRNELAVVLAFCGPYLAAILAFEGTHYRFALPLLPFAALFAVLGLRAVPRLGPVLAGVVLLAHVAAAVQVVRLHTSTDTYEQAAAWLQQNTDRRSARICISPWIELPLVRTRETLAARGLASNQEVAHWLDHQRTMPADRIDELGWSLLDLPLRRAKQRAEFIADPTGFVRGLGVDYFVLDSHDGAERPLMNAVLAAVRGTARLEARFTPQGSGASVGHPIEPYVAVEMWKGDRFVYQMWGAEVLGPCIEIYSLERGN